MERWRLLERNAEAIAWGASRRLGCDVEVELEGTSKGVRLDRSELEARARQDLQDAASAVLASHASGAAPDDELPLEKALHRYFRTFNGPPDIPRQLAPGLSDGVRLLELRTWGGGFHGLGWVWMVDSQRCTPLAIQTGDHGRSLRVDYGLGGLLLSREEIDRMWRRGRFPDVESAVYSFELTLRAP